MQDLLNKKKIVGKPRKISPTIEKNLGLNLEEIEDFNTYN